MQVLGLLPQAQLFSRVMQRSPHHATLGGMKSTPDPLTTELANYVTQKQAAVDLNLTLEALRSRVARGQIQAIRVGRTVLIPVTEIDRVRRTYLPSGARLAAHDTPAVKGAS